MPCSESIPVEPCRSHHLDVVPAKHVHLRRRLLVWVDLRKPAHEALDQGGEELNLMLTKGVLAAEGST